MISFIVYDESGKILRCGFCAQKDLHLQANGSQTAIEHHAVDDRIYHVVDGSVVLMV
jgi:hypothetical protein